MTSVYFGKGSYAEPKFDWVTPIGITALKFLNSGKLGQEYQNNMFVGDINNGLLYRFILNQPRDGILINDTSLGNIKSLADYEVNDPKENQPVVFGQGFGGNNRYSGRSRWISICIKLYWITI